MAYVPPHLRRKSQGEPQARDISTAQKPERLYVSIEEIHNYFWPPIQSDGANDEEGYDAGYKSGFLDGPEQGHGKTLHDSAATPGELAYLILYTGANPRWEADHIVFTKSSLDLLPRCLAYDASPKLSAKDSGETDVFTTSGRGQVSSDGKSEKAKTPIAVFRQEDRVVRDPGYRFEGWFNIERLAFLEPGSPELIRMLDQKWTKTDRRGNAITETRRPENWRESMRMRWAVIKLAKDEKTNKERGPPNVEHLPEKESRSVNEMLAALRLRNSDNSGKDNVVD